MELFLLRHGHAESEAPTDRERPLSIIGREEVEQVIRARHQALANVKQLYVSPYLRAQQTAKIVASHFPTLSLETIDLLIPGGRTETLIDFLSERFQVAAPGAILLVTHQPLVGTLLDELCGCEPGRHRMSTASLAALDVDVMAADCCRLNWIEHVLG